MELTRHERRQLRKIEDQLTAEEPRLHRALSVLSTRPLRTGRIRALARAGWNSPRWRLGLATIALAAAMAMLVVGAAHGWLLVVVPGLVIAQVGPWLLTRNLRKRPALPRRRVIATSRP